MSDASGVMADEARRSQYDFIDGYARHMRDALPHASFLAFAATSSSTSRSGSQAMDGKEMVVCMSRELKNSVPRGTTTTPAAAPSRW